MSKQSIDSLIEGLSEDLSPVRPRRTANGSLWVVSAWAAAAVLFVWMMGMRPDLAHGDMPVTSLLSFWLVVGVGIAAGWSAIRMGMPGVGRDYSGWRWAGLVALALPLSAVFLLLGHSPGAAEFAHLGADNNCLAKGILAGLGVGGALTLWLRGGAPTSPTRAGLVVGIAAGAAGAAIVALHCPVDNVVHIALWHGLAIPLSALAGRIILPPLLRW